MSKRLDQVKNLNWRYIIAELLLIVFGILIALYINNLNEQRKEKIFEKKITQEIKNSLINDHDFHLKNRIDRGNQIIRSADIVLSFLHNRIAYHDSLDFHFWRMNWIMIFEPQTIPFERLKNRGIELLSNENSRLKLLELYDFRYPRLKYFTEDYNNWSVNRIEPFCLVNFEIENKGRGKIYKPIDADHLRNNQEYKNLITEKRSRTASLTDRFNSAKESVKILIEML